MEACTEITTSSLDRDGVLTIINASPRHMNNIQLLASPKIEPLHLKNTSSENDHSNSSLIQKSSEESEEESNLHKSDSGNPAISQENLEKEEDLRIEDLQIVDLHNCEVQISQIDEFSPINDCLPLSPEEEQNIQHNLQNLPIRKSASSIMIEEIDENLHDHIEDNESSEIMGNTDFFKIAK